MEGKVFNSSSNIYQDQAKVLFDYYKQAAEKIVGEEEKFEHEISVCKEELVQYQAQLKKSKLIRNVGFVLFLMIIPLIVAAVQIFDIKSIDDLIQHNVFVLLLLIIPLIVALVQVFKMKSVDELFQQTNTKKGGFEAGHKEIFRNYKVSKLGVAYVPVATRIPFENRSFVIDLSGKVEQQHFQLNTLKQTELFTRSVNDLDTLMQSAPAVDGSEETELVDTDDYSLSIQSISYNDYYGQVDRALRTSAFCLDDLDRKSVSLPVIMPNSEYADQLRAHSASNTGAAPVLNVFDRSKYQEDVERFHSLNQMKKSLENEHTEFEEGLRSKMMDVARSVQAITQVKLASSNHLIDDSNKTLLRILKCSYNHYSPNLESEEIERIRSEKFNYQDSHESYKPFHLKQSSKVRFDMISEKWVAEDGSKTSYPFGIHQIHEEIVAPIVQNLMAENRKERLKIYNNIKDQKIDYLNQWHRDTEDFYARNRAESNGLIDKMRSTLSEYISSYNAMVALKKTSENLEGGGLEDSVVEETDNEAEVFAAFEAKSQEFKGVQGDFTDYMDRLKDDIDRRAERFEHIEYYDASLRDSTFRSYAVANSNVGGLDARRSPLASVNPFFAETSELPPEPAMEAITNEHLSINLPKIAQVALDELDGITSDDVPSETEDELNENDASFDEDLSSSEYKDVEQTHIEEDEPSNIDQEITESELDDQTNVDEENSTDAGISEDKSGEGSEESGEEFGDGAASVENEEDNQVDRAIADSDNEESIEPEADEVQDVEESDSAKSELDNADSTGQDSVACKECGADNTSDAGFCVSCGNQLG